MEFIVSNVTDDEIEILEANDFDWYPDTLDSRDIVIEGSRSYFSRVIQALGRDK